MTIRKTWLAAKAQMDVLDGNEWNTMMFFDSADPNNGQKSFYLKPVIGESVSVRIDPNGTILDIDGTSTS